MATRRRIQPPPPEEDRKDQQELQQEQEQRQPPQPQQQSRSPLSAPFKHDVLTCLAKLNNITFPVSLGGGNVLNEIQRDFKGGDVISSYGVGWFAFVDKSNADPRRFALFVFDPRNNMLYDHIFDIGNDGVIYYDLIDSERQITMDQLLNCILSTLVQMGAELDHLSNRVVGRLMDESISHADNNNNKRPKPNGIIPIPSAPPAIPTLLITSIYDTTINLGSNNGTLDPYRPSALSLCQQKMGEIFARVAFIMTQTEVDEVVESNMDKRGSGGYDDDDDNDSQNEFDLDDDPLDSQSGSHPLRRGRGSRGGSRRTQSSNMPRGGSKNVKLKKEAQFVLSLVTTVGYDATPPSTKNKVIRSQVLCKQNPQLPLKISTTAHGQSGRPSFLLNNTEPLNQTALALLNQQSIMSVCALAAGLNGGGASSGGLGSGMDEVRKELAELTGQKEALSMQLAESAQEVKNANAIVNKLQADNTALKNEKISLQQQLQQMQAEMQQLRLQLENNNNNNRNGYNNNGMDDHQNYGNYDDDQQQIQSQEQPGYTSTRVVKKKVQRKGETWVQRQEVNRRLKKQSSSDEDQCF